MRNGPVVPGVHRQTLVIADDEVTPGRNATVFFETWHRIAVEGVRRSGNVNVLTSNDQPISWNPDAPLNDRIAVYRVLNQYNITPSWLSPPDEIALSSRRAHSVGAAKDQDPVAGLDCRFHRRTGDRDHIKGGDYDQSKNEGCCDRAKYGKIAKWSPHGSHFRGIIQRSIRVDIDNSMAETILQQQSVRKRRRRPRPSRNRKPSATGSSAPRVLGTQSIRRTSRKRPWSLPRVPALSKFPDVRSVLGPTVSAVSRLYHPQDTSVLFAAVIVLLLAARSMVPAGVFYDMATTPAHVALPLGGGSSVLLQRIRPANDYSAAGRDAPASAQQFQKLAVEEYTLVEGDTLLGLALEHDLRMDTLVSFNRIDDVRRMRVGDRYRIPNRDGLLYTVREGDSLLSIANAQGTEANAILDANDMISSEISVGEVLFVPNARMNEMDLKLVLGELFVYPVRARFASGFGMRNDPFTGVRRFHNGIDLAGLPGTPIRAAMAGRVVHIETQIGNYGRFVILRHDRGYQTLYGHLDEFSVRVGEYVSQGGQVGTMGNTGRSTGPHLHFSVIKNGSFVDPLEYLH